MMIKHEELKGIRGQTGHSPTRVLWTFEKHWVEDEVWRRQTGKWVSNLSPIHHYFSAPPIYWKDHLTLHSSFSALKVCGSYCQWLRQDWWWPGTGPLVMVLFSCIQAIFNFSGFDSLFLVYSFDGLNVCILDCKLPGAELFVWEW